MQPDTLAPFRGHAYYQAPLWLLEKHGYLSMPQPAGGWMAAVQSAAGGSLFEELKSLADKAPMDAAELDWQLSAEQLVQRVGYAARQAAGPAQAAPSSRPESTVVEAPRPFRTSDLFEQRLVRLRDLLDTHGILLKLDLVFVLMAGEGGAYLNSRGNLIDRCGQVTCSAITRPT